MKTKAIIFSAPSGAGKTTIVKYLLSKSELKFEFSVSATSRDPRVNEVQGKDYYFISVEDFKNKIENDEFLEWEEVYEGTYYGTLKSEVSRIAKNGNYPIFDVDVEGGIAIKKYFGTQALGVFVMPPDLEALENRLRQRSTETEGSLNKRIQKAKEELKFSNKFDVIIINDKLSDALEQAEQMVKKFISQS